MNLTLSNDTRTTLDQICSITGKKKSRIIDESVRVFARMNKRKVD